ncbi:hypothetical protein Bca52824_001170 [Brassica carinata]|uniref:Uncharacterized protein n=1 Tax=Brassica carinata TaxID=52824 RepID=A0A8X7WIV9_BRACI|nr:hypothetical protein Bca52824_001170 [Brassica carinata]
MFHDVTRWQENIRAQDEVPILVTFQMFNDKNLQDDGITIAKRYNAPVQLSYNNNLFDGRHFNQRTSELAVLNGFKESEIDSRHFCPHTAHWHNRDIYPSDFVKGYDIY